MSARRLHILTAVSLVALYGAIGATGTSLHYLLDSSWSFIGGISDDAGGYYHVHAPDYHGHYHRHSHGHSHSHSHVGSHSHSHAHSHGDVQQARPAARLDTISLTTGENTHPEHACPLLTLVSTLKLSQLTYSDSSAHHEPIIATIRDSTCIAAFALTLNLCPRGPPAATLA
jgi:hypothetical protein